MTCTSVLCEWSKIQCALNSPFRLCASYPEKILVPSWVTDTELENVAAFRSWKRIPAVVYRCVLFVWNPTVQLTSAPVFLYGISFNPRHQSTGAVIGRCGQPEVSWWGWRNADDENLVQSISKACGMDHAAVKHLSNGSCVHSSSGECKSCFLIISLKKNVWMTLYVLWFVFIRSWHNQWQWGSGTEYPASSKATDIGCQVLRCRRGQSCQRGWLRVPRYTCLLVLFTSITLLYQRPCKSWHVNRVKCYTALPVYAGQSLASNAVGCISVTCMHFV